MKVVPLLAKPEDLCSLLSSSPCAEPHPQLLGKEKGVGGSWQVLPLFPPTLSLPFWFLPWHALTNKPGVGGGVPLRASEDPWLFINC